MGADEVYEHKRGHCPCHNGNTAFSKVLDLPGPGLAIYHHTPNVKNTSNDKGPKVLQTCPIEKQYSIVLENTKNVKIKAEDIKRALGNQKITCPRCRFIYKQVLGLIQAVSAINENDVIGVCNHCRMKIKPEILCNECESTVAKFKLSKPSKHLLEEIEYNKALYKSTSPGSKSESEESVDTRDNVASEITTAKKAKEKEFSFYFPKTKESQVQAKVISSTLLLKQAAEKFKQSIDKVKQVSGQQFEKEADSTYKTKTTTSPEKSASFKKQDHIDLNIKHPQDKQSKRSEDNGKQKEWAQENEDKKKRPEEIGKQKERAQENEDEKKYPDKIGKQKKRAQENVDEKKHPEEIGKQKKWDREIEDEKKYPEEIGKQKKRAQENEDEKKHPEESGKQKKHTQEKEDEQKHPEAIEDEKKKQGSRAKKGDETTKEKPTTTPAPTPNIKNEEKSDKKEIPNVKAASEKDTKIDDFQKLKEALRKEKEAAEKDKRLQEMEQEKLRKALLDKVNATPVLKVTLKQVVPPVDNAMTKEMLNKRALLIDPKIIKKHKCHQIKVPHCELCNDSLLDLEVQSIELHNANLLDLDNNIIIGEKLFKKCTPTKDQKENLTLIIDESLKGQHGSQTSFAPQKSNLDEQIKDSVCLKNTSKKNLNVDNAELTKGVIRYSLSDRSFIDKGWTMLPTEKVVRKMNVYRMRPAHPEFDWFEYNKKKKQLSYDTGSTLAEFKENGRGQLFYRNGQLALDYYDAEDEENTQHRFVVYSSGEPDARGRRHPVTVLATFDYSGNGVVLDHAGKIRLKYNQTEGVVLDRSLGPVSHWKWHTLNDPPVLRQVMIDTHMAMKDPVIMKLGRPGDEKIRVDNEDMLAIEFENSLKEQSKKIHRKFKPFQIKMKAMKINEHFSLKVLDQATIYLIFRDGSTNIKLNLGMILDNKEIVDTNTADLGEVSNILENFPAPTESVAAMQRSVAYAQRYERARSEHERRLCRPQPVASADQLLAARARPLHVPPATLPTASSKTNCNCRCSPSTLYYNSRII